MIKTIKKFKYVWITVILVIIVGLFIKSANYEKEVTANVPIVEKVATANTPIAGFDTEFAQCKTIIEDDTKAITDDETKIIGDFERKYIQSNDSQFKSEFLPFLKSKMTEGLTSENVDYIDKLVASSRMIIDSDKEIDKIRLQLIDRSSSLLPRSDRDYGNAYVPVESTESTEPTEPTIGMTSAEASKSTWGSSYRINTTTTAYGVREQWVYANGHYLYLEDGIVSAIQN